MAWFKKSKTTTDLVRAPIEDHRGTQGHSLAERLASEFIASTALSTIQADIRSMTQAMSEQNCNNAMLNSAMGEFKEKLLVPLKEELSALRYNLGAKVEQSTTELGAYVGGLEKVITVLLKAQGMSDGAIEQWKTNYGLDTVNAPRAAEFAAYREQTDELVQLRESNGVLTEQNQRLIERLEALEKKPGNKKKPRHHG